MPRSYARTLVAAAFASSLSPVIAQNSGPLPVYSGTGAIVKTALNAGVQTMAGPNYDIEHAEINPVAIASSIPTPNDVTKPQYRQMLAQIDPNLPQMVGIGTDRARQALSQQRANLQYSMGGYIQPGTVNGHRYEREFMQDRYPLRNDRPVNLVAPGKKPITVYKYDGGAGMAVNVIRASVKTEADFKELQKQQLMSPNAEWGGEGKYFLNGFIVYRKGGAQEVHPLDPYRYLAESRERQGANYDANRERAALAHFDPEASFGIPRGIAAQVVTPSARPTIPLEMGVAPIAPAPGRSQSAGWLAGPVLKAISSLSFIYNPLL